MQQLTPADSHNDQHIVGASENRLLDVGSWVDWRMQGKEIWIEEGEGSRVVWGGGGGAFPSVYGEVCRSAAVQLRALPAWPKFFRSPVPFSQKNLN